MRAPPGPPPAGDVQLLTNAWIDGKLGYLYKYQTETRYESGDDAYAAWDGGDGEDFELITDYTDDEAE